jgi:flagellar basal-body rod protein FlgC
MMDLTKSILISAAGMRAQGTRMRVVAENLANVNSTSMTPGGDPYRRQVVTFSSELDRATGMTKVGIDAIKQDLSDFELKFDPSHPAANEAGYVKLPNVKSLVEMMDMREAQRSYEANVNVIEVTKSMIKRTVDLLKS